MLGGLIIGVSLVALQSYSVFLAIDVRERLSSQQEREDMATITVIVTGSDGKNYTYTNTQREGENHTEFLERWKTELEEFKDAVGAP